MIVSEGEGIWIEPYGGRLVSLLVPEGGREELRAPARSLKRVQLTPRSVCDLELLATGAFSPLDRFMGRADYERVPEEMRLASGALFPLPVTLPVAEDANVRLDEEVALADRHNNLLAVMRAEEVLSREGGREAALACGTNGPRHPLVAELILSYLAAEGFLPSSTPRPEVAEDEEMMRA